MVSPAELKDIGLFSAWSEDDLAKVATLCEEQTFPAGAVLFREGQEADRILFLDYGRVVLEASSAVGGQGYKHPVVVDVVARGETFGWSAIVPPHRYVATARCLSPVKIFAASGKALTKLMEDEPRLGYRLLFDLSQVIAERLADTRQLLVSERSYPT